MSHPLFDILRRPEPALDADHPAPFTASNVPAGWKKPQGSGAPKQPAQHSENVHGLNLETPEEYLEQEQTIDGKVKK